jgi:hypothetical protein
MNKPLSLAEAQARINELEQQIADKNTNKKPVQLLVEFETGFLQIRRLTGKSINLPTFVIRWILEHAQEVLQFITANKHLLADQNDTTQTLDIKQQARLENLKNNANPVVRKPRAENKTEEAA